MPYRIKMFRRKKNITQEELSRLSGVSRATISKLESGEVFTTTTDTLLKIAEALRCKVSDIFIP